MRTQAAVEQKNEDLNQEIPLLFDRAYASQEAETWGVLFHKAGYKVACELHLGHASKGAEGAAFATALIEGVEIMGILTTAQCVDAYNGGLDACKEWLAGEA